MSSHVDEEDAVTIEEYRAKLAREDLVQERPSGPSEEQLRAIERCAKAVGLRVDVSAVRSEEQAARIIRNLMLLGRRMR